MVAIVSGNSLGLSLTSLATLGQRGTLGSSGQGRSGEQAFVNIANGNLVLQDFDDKLEGRGLDLSVLRTYNSQGLLNDDNGDNWTTGAFGQRIQLTGTVGTPGSTLTRTDRDGAQAVYTWDSARSLYVSTAGAGAFDTIAHDAGASRFVWTDGASGLMERYESTAQGRLLSVTDPSGNAVSYAYSAGGTLQSITNANGEVTYFDYAGNQLTQIRTVDASGSTLTRVRYAYDASNRLSTVTVDLSPEDNSVADARQYVTTYTYDGSSTRIASVTQSDGTSLAFTYIQVGGDYRVATVQDGLGQTTSYSYDTANRRTTVIDPLGLASIYTYDAAGQLTQVRAPAVGSVAQTTQFAYNANGDLIQVIDGEGRALDMQYDANGNQYLQRDAAGNTVTRTFDTYNQLLTETAYLAPDPDGAGPGQATQPLTTRYVYDGTGKNQLRFTITPEGRVTEHRYDSYGQRISTHEYAGGLYDTSALGPTAAPSEVQMVGWVGTQDRMLSSRTDIVYDARGQVQQTTTFSKVDAGGNGIADGSQSIVLYVYDRAGRLLGTTSATGGTTQYTYDGLGRQLSAQDALGRVTLTSYDDANNRTTVTLANGLVTTSAYDHNGRLVSVRQSSATSNNLGETQYFYDADNRLYMHIDPTGVRTGMLYDEAGRLVAEIDSSYRVTEYVYDRANQLIRKIAYATPASASAVNALLADPGATPANQLGSVRPLASSLDARSWRIYDAAGRLVRSIDAAGAVTDTQYDGASRVVALIQYSQPISVASLGTAPTHAATTPVPDAAGDRVTRSFYDGDGLLRGTLDAEGYLTELRYDGEGRPSHQIAYATRTDAALRAGGTLAQLLPAASSDDMHSRWLYDAQGRIAGELDAEGYLTERVYDSNGNVTQTVRYATRVNATLAGQITPSTTVADLRPASHPEDRATTILYDLLGRVSQQTNAEGTVTQNTYDSVGHLVNTTTAVATSQARTLSARYDVQGRLIGELSGEGSALLTGGQTQAQIDAIWAAHGLTHSYDAAGRRTSTTDANGNRTLFFYDGEGRLTHTVNALGEVREQRYNTLGQLIATIDYGTRISVGSLQGGLASTALTNAIAQIVSAAKDSTQTFTYAATGDMLQRTDALGNATLFGYNAFGEQTSSDQLIGDGRHLVQAQAFDRRGLATGSVIDASGVNAVMSTEYDAFGRVTRTVDANGNVRQQSYDRLGRVVATIDPVNAQRSAGYDAFGRVLTQTDALGNTTTYSYSKALRSISVTTPEGITVTTVQTRHGQTQQVVDGRGNTTSYAYDRNGNLLTATTPLTVTSSSYDSANRLVQTTDANGNVVAFTYDAANRLLTRTVDPGGLNLVTTYEYDAKGQRIRVTDPNGTLTQLVYDLKGQLLSQVVDPTGLNLATSYTYDVRGKMLSVLSPAGTLIRYLYDNLGRRTQERVDPNGLNLTRTYAYDKNGNLTGSTDANGNLTRYAYDADDRLVFTVDAAGNVRRNDYDAEGRIVKTSAYATPIDLAGLGNAPSPAQISARVVAAPAIDGVEHRVLDKDGRLAATVNGLGEVVKFAYDANGNVVERTAYANRIALAGWTPGSIPNPVADAMHDQRMRYVYDQLDRAIYSVDGTGAVVRQSYDGNGNVVERVAFAAGVPISTSATAADLAAAVALVADAGRDAHDRFVYDRANRLSWSADGVGAVTHRVYDNNGNLIKSVQYATAIAAAAAPDSVAASAGDRVTDMVYDRANRLSFTIDTFGGVTKTGYDRNGNVVLRYAFAQRIGAPSASSRLSTQQVESSLSYDYLGADRVERAVYDAANRQVMTVDATGAVIENQYDAAGNLTRTIAYASRINFARLGTNWNPGYWDVRLLFGTTSADRTTVRAYDAANRLTHSVDALGYVTRNSYDGLGRVTQTTAFAFAIPAATAGAAAIEAALSPDPADRIQSFAYDAAGRLSSSTDALGFTESYGYDALGSKTSFTNKKGAVWTYDYDAAGRLTQETAPAVEMTTLAQDGAGNLVVDEAHSGSANLVTRLAYDALGRLRSRTEALGRPGQRTTSYEYDAVGHQVKVVYPAVGVYDPAADSLATNGASGLAGRTETLQALYTETRYDVFGNAVSNRDVAGNYSYKTYDALGRVRHEVDALGYVTGYQRNAWGEVIELTRFATATALTSGNPPSLGVAQVDAAINAAGIDHGKDRVLSTEYDRAGRVAKVTEPQTFIYDSSVDRAYAYYTAGKKTENVYNAFGDLTRVSESNSEWDFVRTNHYYDLKGQRIATVDAMGYLTTQSFDGAGNLESHMEYATALQDWSPQFPPATLPAPTASADDRLTLYAYDRAGRKTSETRVAVEFSVNSNGTSTRGNLVTGYGYDAVGNLTRTTDATGASTYSYYDALGRVRAIAAPTRSSTVGGAALTPLTEFRRDAYGNAVVTIEYARGAAAATEAAYAVAGTDAADRATFADYDSLGHVTQSTDANRNSRYSSYDAQGHVAEEWQVVTDGDGASRTLFRAYQYDQLGRQTHIVDPASTTQLSGGSITTVSQAQAGLTDTAIAYNAFGEVTGKSVNGVQGEYFDYDNAGRVWRTNAGDGVDKVAFYNLQGRQTAQITSYGSTYENVDLRSFGSADELAWRDLRRTETVYDVLGHVVKTIGAEREAWNTGPTTSRFYTQGTINSSATLVFDESSLPTGSQGTNSVTVAWSSLRGLGSGDVKVVLEYASQTYVTGWTGGETGQGEPIIAGGEIMSRTQVIGDAGSNNGLTMTWEDPANLSAGGISRITRLAIYKKDLYGNWQQISDQSSLGYSGHVMDIDVPDDPSAVVQLELRPAGSEGDSGWTPANLVNFGDAYRFNAAGLPAGTYEYRARMTTVAGATSLIGSGTIALSSPPLSIIATTMAFGQPGVLGAGLFTWQSPGTGIDQVFRIRPAGSTGAWDTRVVSARGNGKDGVDLTLLAEGNYEYELLWIHAGEGVPYAHATGQISTTGLRPPYWVPPQNLPPITGVVASTKTVGNIIDYDESGNPIFDGPTTEVPVIYWEATSLDPVGTTTFRYRLQGSSEWISLPVIDPEPNDDGSTPLRITRSVQFGDLPAGDYEYQIVAHQTVNGTEVPIKQAIGHLIVGATSEGHMGTMLMPVPVTETITPADPANYITGWTGTGPTYGPPVVIGYDAADQPIFGLGYGRDILSIGGEGGTVYGPVKAIPYFTYQMEERTQLEPVQVAVGQDPVPARDESGNILTQPVYETRVGSRPIGVPVQVGTDPVYATDGYGNILYETVYVTSYETRTVPVYGWVQVPRTEFYQVEIQVQVLLGYDENNQPIYGTQTGTEWRTRTVYDWTLVITGWTQETYPVQVEQQRPIITGYQPRYEIQYVWVPYEYQVQVGTQPVYERDAQGNIVYETRYETQMQEVTRLVPVPTLVVPEDPSHFIISDHSGDPIYGPPVITGNDESGNPIYGQGYSVVNGVIVATPYQQTHIEMQWLPVWVPGIKAPPMVVDATPLYIPGFIVPAVPPLYASTTNTQPGTSAISETGTAGAPSDQQVGVWGDGGYPRPVVNQNTDRWGNVIAISDPRSAGWVTTYRYNANNQLIQQVQPDTGTGAAVTELFYDQLGRQVALKDANGHVSGQVYDAGGNLVQSINALGGVTTHTYDAFGQTLTSTVQVNAATSRTTAFTYDGVGRLLQTTLGTANNWHVDEATQQLVLQGTGAIVESSTWDQAGRKLSSTNGNGETLRYVYDLAGHVVQTLQPMGNSTRAAYDARGNKIAEADGNGYVATWSYDYFGRVMAHSDFGGRQYAYTYDNAGQLTSDGSGRSYEYNAEGLLSRIFEQSTGREERYAYDMAGNRVREVFTQGGTVYKDNHIAYDALGRMRWVADGRAHVNIEYDKVGNRTHIQTHVLAQDASLDSNLYFQYNAMNLQTVVDGVDAAGNIGQQGHQVSYNLAGERTGDTWWGKRVVATQGTTQIVGFDPATGQAIYGSTATQYVAVDGYTSEAYGYDNLGRLASVVRDGVQTDARLYDGAGRVVATGPHGTLPAAYAAALNGVGWDGQALAGMGSQTQVNRYDLNGRITRQDVFKSDNTPQYVVFYDEIPAPYQGTPGVGTAHGYDGADNLLGYTVVDWSALASSGTVGITNYANSYERAEGYRQADTWATSNQPSIGRTVWAYGSGGELASVTDVTKPQNNRSFVSDMAGNILYAEQAGQGQHQLVVNGQVLGRYGQIRNAQLPSYPDGTPNFQTKAEFNFGYRPIDGNYPAPSPGTYAVSAGDTLQGIARGAYGDESLWYLIADANGLASNADLKPGQVLTIPARVASGNNADSFRPYDPSRVIGDTTPNLPMPQGKDGDCGAIGQIIVAVVAVVVAWYVGPQVLSAVEGAIGAGTTANVIAGAAAMASGSIVSQGVGVAIGAQDSFSWKQVGLAAISGGVAEGLGNLNLISGSGDWVKIANATVRQAVGNALTQGIGVATGLQDKFDWKGVAASAVGAGVGQAVGGALGLPANGLRPVDMSAGEYLGKRLVTSFAAGATAAAMRGGRVAVQQVATDAFGNALGESLAGAMSSGGAYDEARFSSQEDMRDAAMAQAMGLGQPQGRSGSSWNSGSLPDLYDRTYGAGSQQVDFRRRNGEFVQEQPTTLPASVTPVNDAPLIPDYLLPEGIDARSVAAMRDAEGSTWYGMTDSNGQFSARSADLFFKSAQSVIAQGPEMLGRGDISPSQYMDTVRYLQQSGVSLDQRPIANDQGAYRVEVSGVGSSPNAAEVVARTQSFEDITNRNIIAGTHDTFREIGSALSGGRFGDAWRYMTFEASPEAKAAVNARLFPQPSAEAQRLSTMMSSPAGSIAWGVAGLAGASPSTQDAILQTVAAAGQVAGSATGIYKQTLTAQAPLPFTASATARSKSAGGAASLGPVRAGEGGRFGDLAARRVVGDNLTPHHMPQAAAGRTTYADGGALMLPHSEHVLTRTYGSKGAATLQADQNLPFRDVLARDIRDVRSFSGSRYNEGNRSMLDYYRANYPDLMLKK